MFNIVVYTKVYCKTATLIIFQHKLYITNSCVCVISLYVTKVSFQHSKFLIKEEILRAQIFVVA